MLARFLSNTRGRCAPLMAVVAVPVLAVVGMAVDYTRANAARTAFQVSLDATALMLSKTAANDEALQTHATDTFNALYKHPEVNNITVTPVYTSGVGGSHLTLEGTGVINTNFLSVIGTQNRWYARQQIACSNVKLAKIDRYTIQVNTGGDPISTLLQNCASDPKKFFHLTSADQMTATFQEIGTNLTKLRVAQ
ncbi:MAG: pilus assembly protein TadG-related protein [Pseudolabrys sp.]